MAMADLADDADDAEAIAAARALGSTRADVAPTNASAPASARRDAAAAARKARLVDAHASDEALALTGQSPPLRELPLRALPAARRTALRKLFAGANRLRGAALDDLCGAGAAKLLHAGLSYNPIERLPPPHVLSAGLPALMSLDVAHCDLCSLPELAAACAALPALRFLSAEGNPLCLVQHWRRALLSGLPLLERLDGARLGAADRAFDGDADADLLGMLLKFQPDEVPVRVSAAAAAPTALLFDGERAAAERRRAAMMDALRARAGDLGDRGDAGGGGAHGQGDADGGAKAGEQEGAAPAATASADAEGAAAPSIPGPHHSAVDGALLPPPPTFEYCVRLRLPTGEYVTTARGAFARPPADGPGHDPTAAPDGDAPAAPAATERFVRLPVSVATRDALRSGVKLELVRFEVDDAGEGDDGEAAQQQQGEAAGPSEAQQIAASLRDECPADPTGEVVASGVAAVPHLLLSAASSAATPSAEATVSLVTAQPLLDENGVLLRARARDEVHDSMLRVRVRVSLHEEDPADGGAAEEDAHAQDDDATTSARARDET